MYLPCTIDVINSFFPINVAYFSLFFRSIIVILFISFQEHGHLGLSTELIVYATISTLLNIYFLIRAICKSKRGLRNTVSRLSARSNGNESSRKDSKTNEIPIGNENNGRDVEIGTEDIKKPTQGK